MVAEEKPVPQGYGWTNVIILWGKWFNTEDDQVEKY
jgi:hypothetical protein